MKDLKKIQEFFSKPLNEEKEPLDIIDLAKVVKAVQQTGHPVTVLLVPKFNEIEVLTGMNAPDDMLHDLSNAVDSLGYGRNDIIIAGDSSNLSRREYSDIRRVNGGHKDYFEEVKIRVKRPGAPEFEAEEGKDYSEEEANKYIANAKKSGATPMNTEFEKVDEVDMNDPVLMRMRAAKDKLAKMRAANAGDDGNDKFFDNAKKIAFLKKERAQLMRDMEQEAEPEGGPIADEYGSKLNRIDKAIAKLQGRKEMTYDQAIAENALGFNDSRLSSDQHIDLDYAVRDDKRYTFGNDPYADDQLRYEYAEKMGFLEEKEDKSLAEASKGAKNYFDDLIFNYQKAFRYLESDEKKEYQRLAKNYFSSLKESINEYDVYMPSQEEVDKFFALTNNETHYLNSKPVMGQEGTFNLMPIEPWDEYDYSNWKALVRKAKQQDKLDETYASSFGGFRKELDGETIENELQAKGYETPSTGIWNKILVNKNGERVAMIDTDESSYTKDGKSYQWKGISNFISHVESIDENDSYARVSMPRFVKDKNNPNFLNVYIDYDLGPGGSPIALGKETMTGQIRRLSAAKAMGLAGDVARDLEAEYNLEDIEVTDLKNGKVRIFAVSDDFINMDPNMLGENKSVAQTLAETIKLGAGVIEEELCPKGKAYIKRRKAAGEKSSAYLSGRAVKVCKGQMSGRAKNKK